MNCPSLLIQYDPLTWKPTAIFSIGRDDTETATIKGIAERMLASIEEPERSRHEN